MTPSPQETPAQPAFVPGFPGRDGGSSFRPRYAQPATESPFQPLALVSAPATGAVAAPLMPSAEDLLRQAREQAARILAEAEAQAVAQSQATVEAVRREQVEAFEGVSAELLGRLREQSQDHQQQLEQETAALVVGIARRVLHERFEADEAAIVPVVREALQALAASERVQIVVAPRHQPALRAAHQKLLQVLKENTQLEIVTAEAAEPFGCVVHGDEGSLDARLENRLQALQHAVAETLASDPAA